MTREEKFFKVFGVDLDFIWRMSAEKIYEWSNRKYIDPAAPRELVHCKDCIYHSNSKFNCWRRNGDEWCNRGEKKDEE